MLNKIIHFSLQNRILVLVASVLLLIGGTYTAMHTEVDVFPDLNAPTVVIMTEANGMAAEEVEQLVTFPVETAVNGATGVRRVRSSSTNGFSVVWVEFDWETDVYLARQIVSEKLAVVSESLPSNVGKPTLGPQSSILGEMLIVGLTADSTSMLDLRTIADWTIRPRLLSTGGVAQVAVLGGDIKEYQIVLFLFLANVRTTVISLVTLPLSLIASLLALHYMGFTINTMSLGGMAIAIGSLVDDAIVDVENVYKRLRENRMKPEAERLPILEVVFNASKEVRMPILNSTLIIVVSFVPLFFLSGMEGRMLVPLGIAFIVALAASTVVALTVTPVLCSYLLGKEKIKDEKHSTGDSPVARKMKEWYGAALAFVLGHKKSVLGGTIGLFAVALACFFTLGRSFLPPFNEGSFTINISSLPVISLEESDKMGHRAEELLLSIPEIQTVARKTGRAELDEHALGVNVSEI